MRPTAAFWPWAMRRLRYRTAGALQHCFDDCVFQRLVEGRTADEVRAELFCATLPTSTSIGTRSSAIAAPENYGFTDFVQPAVFDRLVQQDVLIPLQPIDGFAARTFAHISCRVARFDAWRSRSDGRPYLKIGL